MPKNGPKNRPKNGKNLIKIAKIAKMLKSLKMLKIPRVSGGIRRAASLLEDVLKTPIIPRESADNCV